MNANAASPVRVGVLGAAGIARDAVVVPARDLEGVQVSAIAARDPRRAQRFADKHGIPRIHSSYEALLSDQTIDAVYVPLPAAHHERWATAALEAGKHVLVEKPFTSNAATAERLAQRAAHADTIVMEAYHSGHHPLQQQLRTIINSGTLGTITSASAAFCAPIPPGKNLRWNLALGGGGLLDVGYYPVRLLRDLFGEVRHIDSAHAHQRDGIDRLLTASLTFDSNIRGDIVSSIWSRRLLDMSLTVIGTAATLKVSWPYHPQNGSKIRINGPGIQVRARANRLSSYSYQLAAFRDAIRDGAPIGTDAAAAAAQMRSIDEIYAAAGMQPRP
jgi:predicted dehydrogenase